MNTFLGSLMDTHRNFLKEICLCPGRDDGRPHNYLRHRCNDPQVRFWNRKDYEYPRAITPGNEILRVSQRIHAEALPILYRSRNFEFCDEDRSRADSLYSVAFFISSLSQYAKPHLQELTINLGVYWYNEKPHRYRRSFAGFRDLISSELKGLKKLNIEFGFVYSTMLVSLSRRSVRKKVTNLEDIRTQKGSFNQKYWWVDGANVLGPLAALLGGNRELTLSIPFPVDYEPYIPKICGVDGEEAFGGGRHYINQEQANRFFAKINDKRYARKARKTAGEGGMELPEGLEEFLLSCQDSM